MKNFIGIVVSTKPQQTAVVRVDRLWQHPLYKKRVTRSKKYQAHDLIGVAVGDKVELEACRPVSKFKKWRIKQVVK